ncbi:hypothetical protein ACFFU1_02000 [Algibacter miyuki]|uniref:Uncharacterized protein n=1 Tax=Algibacter miyuki TaxID=1306933 RepID=A0ABV5GVJ3_9FLAO|nr:hypothetical protein [Algibacter miyuki]MDN3664986.1 hypothetical protein [Algibacter miyuki]
MKHIYKWFFCVLLFGCSTNDNNLLEDHSYRGGYIEFQEVPTVFNYDFLKIDSFNIESKLIDANNNATKYSLALIHEDNEVLDFVVFNAFPANLSIDFPTILNALGLTMADVDETDEFRFVATVTTPDGIYSGEVPDFNSTTNENEGGNTVPRLLINTTKQAMDFTVRFFVPPPKKLRGTSFEEPETNDANYTRPAAVQDVDGELLNNTGERPVMYVAKGTGVDDEIGFRTFFTSTGNGAGDNGFVSEPIGVTTSTTQVGSYPDGVQGYQIEDADGLIKLVFDKVVIDPGVNPSTGVQIKYFLADTSWETIDFLHIYVEIEKAGGVIEVRDLVDLRADAMEDFMGRWNTVGTNFLQNVVSYTLTIDAEANQPTERFFFDEMLVFVPEE